MILVALALHLPFSPSPRIGPRKAFRAASPRSFLLAAATRTIALAAVSAALLAGTALAAPLPVLKLLPLQDPLGFQRLIESDARTDYGPLAQTFLTQANLAYCGVASATMVLNSLSVPPPPAAGLGSYRYWTQENLLPAAAGRSPLTATLVASRGMTLVELDQLLAALGVTVRRLHGDQLSLAALRSLMVRSLADPSDRLIVNVERSALGQGRGGHISPVGAYHASSDSVLLLDVARYRFPAAWIPLADLWRSMRTLDTQSGRARGLVIVSPAAKEAPPRGG